LKHLETPSILLHPYSNNKDNESIMAIAPELLTGLGSAISIFLSATGAAIASSHAGVFLIRGSEGIKSFAPIVIAGVLAIYGIIVSVLLVGKLQQDGEMTAVDGYRNLSAGLAVGLACCASGWGLAHFLKQCNKERTAAIGTRDVAQLAPPEPNVKFMCVLVFMEAIGLYGLIVALFLLGPSK
jgi:V-type H+-transporting ATPase proteolipid subunit